MNVKETVLAFFRKREEMWGQGALSKKTEQELLATDYLEEKILDSMGIVEMVVSFESQCDVHFEPEHMQSSEFRTIGGLIQLIEDLRQGKVYGQPD